MKKRLVSLLLAFSMMLTFLPVGAVTAFAAEAGNNFDFEGITYKILDENSVSVVKPSKDTAPVDLVIPAKATDPETGTSYDVTEIAAYAFKDCTSLQSVFIPKSITDMQHTVFKGCSNLKTAIFEKGIQAKSLMYSFFEGCTSLENVNIPEEAEFIGSYAFRNCTSLKEIEIPSKVRTVYASVFENCTSLESFTIPATLEYTGADNCGASFFKGCTNLKKVTFEAGSKMKDLRYRFFEGCTSLESVELPEGIERIGSFAFLNCTSLKHVTLPSTTKIAFHEVFTGCTSLEEVTLPEGMESIDYGNFKNCTSLKKVMVPSTLKKAGAGNFEGCTQLEKIYYNRDHGWSDFGEKLESVEPKVIYCYKVTFKDGENELGSTRLYGDVPLSEDMIPGNLSKPGYVVSGWYTDPDFSNEFHFDTCLTGNTELFARWEKAQTYPLTVNGGSFTVDGKAVDDTAAEVYEGAKVTVKLDAENQLWKDSGLTFGYWDIKSTETLKGADGITPVDNREKEFTFIMPKNGVEITAMSASIDDGDNPLGAAAAVTVGVVGSALLAYQLHELGTEFWLNYHLPNWAVIPQNRIQLAEVMWQDAGCPEPESDALYEDIAEDDSDAQKAARWAVENQLMDLLDDDKPAEFVPYDAVSHVDAIRAWKKYQER